MAETNKKKRFETYALAVLLVLLAIVLYRYRDREAAFAGIQSADTAFRPLGVSDPALRLDLLGRLQKKADMGGRRNIFAATLPPSPAARAPKIAPVVQAPVIPQPVAPPPLVVPATLYGIATEVATGRRKAIFTSGDDVFIVLEGGTLLGQYRVDKIGNNSVDVEEISSGRKTTLTLTAPVDSSQSYLAQQ